MNRFNQVAVVDALAISDLVKIQIQEFSKGEVYYPERDARDEAEAIKRIGDADAVLGNWQTTITTSILDNAPNLRYVGICGTNLANIDQDALRERGITLKNVVDYGDEGVAEYIFAQLLNLFRGFGEHQWRSGSRELCRKTIGIVGLGATGQQVARVALGLNMHVVYHSKTRNTEWENKGLWYYELQDLLHKSDIVSLHVPKNLNIMGEEQFESLGNGKVLVDTCLGIVYQDFNTVKDWLSCDNNYLIRDHQPDIQKELSSMDRFIYTHNITAGLTAEAVDRLGAKVVENIRSYLGSV